MDVDGFGSLEARARVHAALGDPGRLAIVDRLLMGDASPGELGQVLGMPTNLLAHHLKLLQEAGVVERRRSEGDRRRTYLRLIPRSLSGLVPATIRRAPRIVFVCTHNSARSQLAAALWGRASAVPAASAGTSPAPRVNPRVLALAARHDLDLARATTRHVDQTLRPGDLVVAVCDAAHEQLAGLDRLHWSIPDPVRAGSDEAFEQAYTDIADRVQRLAPAIRPPKE
ncbi:ArsR family transcriptional regulator [Nonomuraea turkmeniaca]|uniref:ArsR family transcriptional regulator n=1 Tax=Nonomuraea turkmeniaca TaxID=103838 RepID=A0A5S4F4P2_9ACTN|nr:MarR family transcriptional regulator [Nonomuraea turkmeniaca]TMR11126.1 ArsR family transcriptional regulator [Nonomuraea turkmeniaca]